MADNEFDRSNYDKNEIRILSAFFASKKLTRASFLTSNAKKAFNFL